MAYWINVNKDLWNWESLNSLFMKYWTGASLKTQQDLVNILDVDSLEEYLDDKTWRTDYYANIVEQFHTGEWKIEDIIEIMEE